MTAREPDMWERVDCLADQLRASAEMVRDAALGPWARPQRVLVCGMGGSAAAGGLLAGVYESDFEMRVARRYDPPSLWARHALVVFSSYSGNTEETLRSYERLAEVADQRVVVSSGGELLSRARKDGVPVVELPGGWPPRSALGWGIGSIARILGHAGLVDAIDADLEEVASSLDQGREIASASRADESSQLQRLVSALEGRLPFLYASDGLTEAVALRWRAQLNENAKMLVGHALLPELDHNEVVGWESPTAVRDGVAVVALRDQDEPARVSRRFEVTRQILGDRVRGWIEVRAGDGSRLSRAMELVQLGDYLSVLLAERHGVDPTPVDSIDRLKSEL